MKILSAGDSSFLGSHLCEALLIKGHDVVCLDNYSTGDKKNVARLLNYNNFEVIRHDITFPIF